MASENRVPQNQNPTIPPAWYTDGRMESNAQKTSILTIKGQEPMLPNYIQQTDGNNYNKISCNKLWFR